MHQAQIAGKDWQIKEILIKKSIQDHNLVELKKYLPASIPIIRTSNGELDKIAGGRNHQGMICLKTAMVQRRSYRNFHDLKNDLGEKLCGPLLILDRIQDVGNLGSILRSAECFGFQTVILPEKDSAEITDAVERISSGAVHYLKIYRVTNLKQAVEQLKQHEFWIIAAADTGEGNWQSLPALQQIALIIGNENQGIKRILLEQADFIYSLPMRGKISSLNAAVSAAVFMDRITSKENIQ